jgi:hypothetical protein
MARRSPSAIHWHLLCIPSALGALGPLLSGIFTMLADQPPSHLLAGSHQSGVLGVYTFHLLDLSFSMAFPGPLSQAAVLF